MRVSRLDGRITAISPSSTLSSIKRRDALISAAASGRVRKGRSIELKLSLFRDAAWCADVGMSEWTEPSFHQCEQSPAQN